MGDMYAVDGDVLADIATAIRTKRDITDGISVADMPMQIGLISGGVSGFEYIGDVTGTDSTYGYLDLSLLNTTGEHVYFFAPKSKVNTSGAQAKRNPIFGFCYVCNPKINGEAVTNIVHVAFMQYNNSTLSRVYTAQTIDTFGGIFEGSNVCRFNGNPIYAVYEMIITKEG